MPRDVNEQETMGERMTVDQLAASAYRAATYASGNEPVAWGLLPELDRQSWLRVAEQAEAILAANDGKVYKDAGAQLQVAFVGPRPSWVVERGEAVAWEAVARHLTQLFDDDEIDNRHALEQSWRDWAFKRLQTWEKQP